MPIKSILTIFFAALGLALVLTPATAWFGRRLGFVDRPSERKVHEDPVPRIGGVAIFLAFGASLLTALAFSSSFAGGILHTWHTMVGLACGTCIVFLVGLADDMIGVHYAVKFLGQAAAAVFVYSCGIAIREASLPWAGTVHLGIMSLPATVFWFLLVINAFNLIDGLDGLAAGISFFSSLVLLLLSLISGNFVIAPALAALAGASLGFLRYNFNPASIFMGDSGSYFLGFMLAALSLLGTMKSQTTVAILIPLIALGVPLFDTILAPIRRFILGKELFRPDKSHVHHALLRLGLSHRRAVLMLYGATVIMGILALLLIHARNHEKAFILLAASAGTVFALRWLGYLNHFGPDRIKGYLHDVIDEVGIKKDRRAFLNCQLSICDARDPDDLWEQITTALEKLGIDMAVMSYNGVTFNVPEDRQYRWCSLKNSSECRYSLMTLDLPLSDDLKNYGILHLKKDSLRRPIDPYTLKRIEHLRRSIVRKLRALEEGGPIADCALNLPASDASNRNGKSPGGT